MIIADAGPLMALIDADDAHHGACTTALEKMSSPLVTTWPAFTEAMYLLGTGGWQAQSALWNRALDGSLMIADQDETDLRRIRHLMEQYSDVPMDLADATLVCLAERTETRRVFTVDSDFRIYRYKGRQSFDIVPS